MSTLGLAEAAALLHMSTDALLRKSRAGIVPGAKFGRRWVYVRDDLLALIREQAKARQCRSIANLRAPTGSSDSVSAASKLDAALRQLTERKPRNLKPGSGQTSGGKPNLASVHDIRGTKRSSAGIEKLMAATGNATKSA